MVRHARRPVVTLRVSGKGRAPVLLAYLACTMILVLILAGRAGRRAIPVAGGFGRNTDIGLPVPEIWLKDALGLAIPPLGYAQPSVAMKTTGDIASRLGRFLLQGLGDLNPGQPSSLLTEAMPALLAMPNTLPKAKVGQPLVALMTPMRPSDLGLHQKNPANARVPNPAPPPPTIYGTHPKVVLYETFSQQSFFPVLHRAGLPTAAGHAQSSIQAASIVSVAKYLAKALAKEHIGTLLSRAINDPDGEIGAYLNSGRVLRDLIRRAPALRLALDVQRDKADRAQTTWQRAQQPAIAKILIVLGTNDRLPDPNWRTNLALARRLGAAINAVHPGVLRGIYVSVDRLNQELSPKALVVEIGGPDNTMAEEDRAAAILAQAIARLMPSAAPLARRAA